jgi:hypothetical protein
MVMSTGANIRYECSFCHAENWTDLGKDADKVGKQQIALVCGSCCLLNNGHAIQKDPKGQSWLQCLPYEGILKDVPTGSQKVLGITLYANASGKLLTREEFVMKHGIDPKCALLKADELDNAFRVGRPAKKFNVLSSTHNVR